MATAKEKERQCDNGVVDGNGGKPSTVDGGKTVTETETETAEEKVNQFFEILRRVHVAAQYFEKDNGGGRLALKKRKRGERNNTAERNGVRNGDCEGERVGGRVGSPKLGFDLNSVPEPDGFGS